jgi:polyphosphate kinase 2 (PPK2 family)
VLIVKVHHEFLQTELLPHKLVADKHIWRNRYRSIINFEEHLYQNGTQVIKFFLHLSKEEQRKRLLKRIDDPEKNWKFNMADLKERRLWNHYRNAYETCIEKTSTKIAPWYIIPADDKSNARLIMSQIICNTLKDFKMQPQVLSKSHIKELHSIRVQLLK